MLANRTRSCIAKSDTRQLETDNHGLRQQITQLNSDVRDLNDALDAARAMNRDLMNELNRNAGLPVTYVQHTDASR